MRAIRNLNLPRFVAVVLTLVALFVSAGSSLAQAVRATASMSTNNTKIGEPVEYSVVVSSSISSDNIKFPEVDGLEIHGTSIGTQFSFSNGLSSRQTTVTYVLIPRREGTFSIPPVEVNVDGRTIRTKPFTLTVGPGRQAEDAGDVAFAEIRLAKKSAYIGEALPIEVRLYFDINLRWDFPEKPILSGNGFTTQEVIQGAEQRMSLAGKQYSVMTLRTIITPGQAGKITVGPFPLNTVVSRRLSMFSGRRVGGAQNLKVVAPEVELDVKLLPTEGQPPEFNGAIGKFRFEGIGTPNRVNVGEPVQMVLTVSGEGNFDRIRTPSIANANGWRIYDAEEKFQASDALGIEGNKTFSVPVAPISHQTRMPVFVFAYFDPDTGKYHTLRSTDAPLAVTGAPPTPPVTAATPAEETSAPKPQSPPAIAQDILSILPNPGPAWAPGVSYSRPVLYGLLAAPAPILAFLLFWRSRRGDARALIVRQYRREKAQLLDRIKHSSDRAEVFDAAAHWLQVEAALVSNKTANACELPDILAARRLKPDVASAVEALFNERASLVYAGGVRDSEKLRSTDRDRILDTIANYERSSAQ